MERQDAKTPRRQDAKENAEGIHLCVFLGVLAFILVFFHYETK